MTAGLEEGTRGREQSSRFEWLNRRRLFLITMAGAVIVYSQFQFWEHPTEKDHAIWDYFAQVISRGGVPYRDVVDIKTPLSAYIGAAAIVIAPHFGLRDIIAIRLAFLLLAILTVGFTFLVGLDFSGSRRVGLLASVIMLGVDLFGTSNSGGIQPKTSMVLFGLLTLWAIRKDKPIWAGLFGMLSALSWQPGLLFVGTGVLAFSRYLTNWRDWKVARSLVGATVPLALLLAYFWLAGALQEFYQWGVHYNLTLYGPGGVRSISRALGRFGELVQRPYRQDRLYFYLAAAGIIVALFAELKRARRRGISYLREAAPGHAIIIAPSVYFFFCLISLQGGPDLIPLLPFVGVFAAIALVLAIDQTTQLLRRALPKPGAGALEHASFAAVLVAVVFFSVADAFTSKRVSPTLKDQDSAVAEITSLLKPEDKIFVHGQTEILVLSGLTNASKYVFLERGKDTYLNTAEPGGFEGWFERLKSERPKVVALSRLGKVKHKQDLQDWADAEYEPRATRLFSYYVRKDDR
ncbi:MAG: DolP-mannose mannosyltransferase [Blastocatellia bacterium]